MLFTDFGQWQNFYWANNCRIHAGFAAVMQEYTI